MGAGVGFVIVERAVVGCWYISTYGIIYCVGDCWFSVKLTGFLIRKLPEINVSSSSDEDYTDAVQIEHCYVNERPNKQLQPTPQSTKIVGEIKNREGDVRPIHVLLDTGTSATIVLKCYVM